LHATAALATTVRAAVHPALVLGNGLSNGALFFDAVSPTKQLVDAMDGGVAEAWIRGSKTPVKNFPTEALWQQNVQMLISVEAQGKPLLTLTKLWVTATPAQHQQWYQYVLASFLMGTQGRSAFFYSDGFKIGRTTPCALCNLNIGTPLGPYAKAAGVFQRPFSSGRVLVNPTPATVKVALGGTYYTVAHQAVTTVTMGPNTGVILTRT
jgi:hypothetical protein